MNTTLELTEKSTALEEVEKNTASGSVYNSEHFQESARRGAAQFYNAWLTSNLEKDAKLFLTISAFLHDFAFSRDSRSLADYVCRNLLLMLEKEGKLKPAILGGYSAEALALFDKIILTPGQLPRLEQEEEEEPIIIPDEYFVEGIHVDWKSTFKFHERLNKVREKYGIRRI